MPDESPSSAELLAQVRARRAELDAAVATFVPDHIETPGATGWTVKDHLAHIAAWERSLLALLAGADRDAAIGVAPSVHQRLGVDGVNAEIFALHRATPYATVRHNYDATHAELLARLESMSDADLGLPYSHYQPGDPPYNPAPVIGWVTGNTTGHYAEHLGWLRTLATEIQ